VSSGLVSGAFGWNELTLLANQAVSDDRVDLRLGPVGSLLCAGGGSQQDSSGRTGEQNQQAEAEIAVLHEHPIGNQGVELEPAAAGLWFPSTSQCLSSGSLQIVQLGQQASSRGSTPKGLKSISVPKMGIPESDWRQPNESRRRSRFNSSVLLIVLLLVLAVVVAVKWRA